jgi:hypothetical protein
VAQATEHLPNKYEAVGSNSSNDRTTTKHSIVCSR